MEAGHGPRRPWWPLSWPPVSPLRTCARLSPAIRIPWTKAAAAASSFLSWTGQSVAWRRSEQGVKERVRACVCSRLLAQGTCSLQPLFLGRETGHQKARADDPELSWVTRSGEVGSRVPPALWL